MGIVVSESSESDLTGWTSETDGDGDLNWSASAAMAGSSGGIEIDISDTNPAYVTETFTQLTSTSYRFRFYIDPHSASIGASESCAVAEAHVGGNMRAEVWFGHDGADYRVRVRVWDDNSTSQWTSWYTMSDGPHYIEVLVTYATSAISNNGVLSLWIDGSLKQSITTLDLYNVSKPSDLNIGAIDYISAGWSGTIYFDEVVLRDDNSEIGPASGGAGIIPLVMHHRQQIGVR